MSTGNIDIRFIANSASMNERPTRHETYLSIAQIISFRGTCQRAKVGCVITQDNRIVATGYNGPLGSIECNGVNCNLLEHCKNAVHAEANAIAFAAREGISLKNSTLYCLYSPCADCAKLIIQAGIIRVIYREQYSPIDGYRLLIANGLATEKI